MVKSPKKRNKKYHPKPVRPHTVLSNIDTSEKEDVTKEANEMSAVLLRLHARTASEDDLKRIAQTLLFGIYASDDFDNKTEIESSMTNALNALFEVERAEDIESDDLAAAISQISDAAVSSLELAPKISSFHYQLYHHLLAIYGNDRLMGMRDKYWATKAIETTSE